MSIFASLVFLFFQPLAVSASKSQLSARVGQFLQAHNLKPRHFGLLVSQISSDTSAKPVYMLNAKTEFTAASLTKIPSLSSFYKYFSPDKQFETRLLLDGVQAEENFKGNLVLQGGGDPSFTSESLWNLVNIFMRTGIKVIEGDILIDSQLFTRAFFRIFTERSYETPISASSFNWNAVTFRIRPGRKLGSLARIFVDPENPYIRIKNKLVTKNKKTNIKLRRINQGKSSETFLFEGSIKPNQKEVSKFRNIKQPELWLGYNLKSFLARRGISVKGQVQEGACSKTCSQAALWKSKPFSRISHDFMKFSSNFIARMLASSIPLEQGARKGSYKEGVSIIRKYLNQQALGRLAFKEPSGLDRANKLSPSFLEKILLQDLQSFYAPEIFASYPLPQGPGTLEKRYKKSSKLVHIRAKTGYLSGVVGLAGLAQNIKNKYVFVFMYNGPSKKTLEVQNLFDSLTLLLL